MTPRQCSDTALFVLLALLSSRPGAAAPTFERVLEKPCRALALDREPYVAALGDDAVTVMDKRGTHDEPLPDALRGAGVEVGVFFGRDYRVRVAGTARGPSGDEVRYYRSLPGGLRPALDELGPLGARGAPGLVALLGTADPEIVCRTGLSCLIKTIRGWAKASAPPGLERVGLSLGSGWAVAGQSFFHLKKDWQPLAAVGPWKKADDAFVRGEHVCVVERGASKLHHYDGAAWRSTTAPVAGPRSVWGTADSMWVAGDGGAAYLAGEAFQKVSSVTRVAQVLGRSAEDVWLCTETGVYRSR
ncbi:MAG: hypothetical protein EOO73_04250 [Myxococcales bacterium]|nr:MAG: hypothetical protein EOO73_04250 [Myxococcales bacterium]